MLNKLKRLLYEKCIDYTEDDGVIKIDSLHVSIKANGEHFEIDGCGYSNKFEYSAEYVANVLDNKFKMEKEVRA